MPITYNSETNTVTVVGYSESSPCTFEDIYNASVSNGWNIAEKVDEHTYIFKAKIQIGDGETWTYFADKEKTIIFTSDVVLDYHEAVIKVKRHAYFWIGRGDEDTRTGYRGCIFNVCDVIFNNYAYVIFSENESDIRLYGSTIVNVRSGYRHNLWLEGSVNRVWTCEVKGGGSGIHPSEKLDVNELRVEDCQQGWVYGYNPVYPITNIDIEHNDIGVYFYANQVYNLRNARFMGNNITIHVLDLSAVAKLTNCKADSWTVQWGGTSTEDAAIERLYAVKFKVTDVNGNPLENRVVKVYDKDGNLVAEALTDSSGLTDEIEILYAKLTSPEGDGGTYIFHDEDWEYFNPFTVEVWYGNELEYRGILTELNVESTFIQLTVKPSTRTIDDVYNEAIVTRKIQTNRWKIEDCTLIIYDDDDTTPLLKFNLYDKQGNPAEFNVYERKPVRE